MSDYLMIDPKSIKGEHLICRTNYLEFFFTTNKHLFIDFDDQNIEENQESYTKKSFWIQKDFLSEKFENDKIKARHSSRISQGQHRLFSCQYDLFLECNITFENLDRLALTTEAIKNFFVLIFAYADVNIQIDYICFKPRDKEKYITAIRNTYIKDKKQIDIDPYGVAISFHQINNFSAILEKWIDFCIKNKNFQYVTNILEIINKKEQSFHLYSDLLFLIGMIENFIEQQQILTINKTEISQKLSKIDEALEILSKHNFSNEELQQYEESIRYGIENIGLGKKLSEFFKFSLSQTKCNQTKSYFNNECRKKLRQQIVEYRN